MKQNHNFQNQAFASVFEGITSHMPSVSFFGIIAVYLITASLNSFFLSTLIPTWLAVGLSACIQYGRYAIVFTDFLNPTGFRSPLPYRVALFATIAALAELGVSASHFTSGTTSAFWALFLSGGMVITLGYFLEISFLEKGSEAFGLVRRPKIGAVRPSLLVTPDEQTVIREDLSSVDHGHTARKEELPKEEFPEMDLTGRSLNGHAGKD